MRGKTVNPHTKRRRWQEKTTKEVIQQDWNITAKRTRTTMMFVPFF